MRDDFAALILTHGRPGRVATLGALERYGYTGRTYLVVDDEDATLPQYQEAYGADRVLVFSKREIAERFDEGDNFRQRGAVFYARNASFELAQSVGVRYFIQLDDDYTGFYYRFDADSRSGTWRILSLDWLFSGLCEFLAATPFASVAIAQGGDHIGGPAKGGGWSPGRMRKAMNTFVCDVERPFSFVGRINEDVNTYTCEQRRGVPFLTFPFAQVNQAQTQLSEGGMTDLYRQSGTYVKTFYSVMYAPSAVDVATMGDPRVDGVGRTRIHHRVNWDAAAPWIVREDLRKP